MALSTLNNFNFNLFVEKWGLYTEPKNKRKKPMISRQTCTKIVIHLRWCKMQVTSLARLLKQSFPQRLELHIIAGCTADREFCSTESFKPEWCDHGNNAVLTYNGEEGTPYSFCPHTCGQCSAKETGSNTGSNGIEETGTESSMESNGNAQTVTGSSTGSDTGSNGNAQTGTGSNTENNTKSNGNAQTGTGSSTLSDTGSNGNAEKGTGSSTESNTGSSEINESTNGSGGTSKNK